MGLISKIKKKREFRGIDDSFVQDMLDKAVKSNQINVDKKPELAVKKTRALLREVYGAFVSKNFNKREKLLHLLKGLDDIEGHKQIMKLHVSTAERLNYYTEVYETIFSITGKPSSILDIACGLNPLSYPLLGFKVKYTAYELSEKDALFIQEYFDLMKIDGKTLHGDITKDSEINRLPQADVCFLFKAIDTLESIKWNVTSELIGKLKCKWIVASFPLKSLGGRKNISEKRLSWFVKIISGLEYKRFNVGNEVFFIVRKA